MWMYGTQGPLSTQRPLFYLSPWFCAPSLAPPKSCEPVSFFMRLPPNRLGQGGHPDADVRPAKYV